MIWLVCAVLATVAGWYVVTPLFRKSDSSADIDLFAETEPDRLFDRKEIIYKNLKDLEFEYKMGRLSDGDFRQLSASYKNEAAAVLQELDRLDAHKNIEGTIEKELAVRKSELYGSGMGKDREAARCPSCGAETIPGKKYCADCGRRLSTK